MKRSECAILNEEGEAILESFRGGGPVFQCNFADDTMEAWGFEPTDGLDVGEVGAFWLIEFDGPGKPPKALHLRLVRVEDDGEVNIIYGPEGEMIHLHDRIYTPIKSHE